MSEDNENIDLIPTSFQVEKFSLETWKRIGDGIMDWLKDVDNEDGKNNFSYKIDQYCSAAHLKYHDLTELLNIDILYPITKKPNSVWDPCSGFYFHAKSSSWIQLHCNFPHHRKNAQKALLGTTSDDKENRESFANAIRDSDLSIDQLEQNLIQSGAIASVVRQPKEKRPQSCLIRFEEIISNGLDGSFNSNNNNQKQILPLLDSVSSSFTPLKGIRVVDCSRVLAGPQLSQTLAWFGADVLQVSSQNLP